MEQIITEFISKWGYTAIFILILLENVLPVVPSRDYSYLCWFTISEIPLIYMDTINYCYYSFVYWSTHFVLYL